MAKNINSEKVPGTIILAGGLGTRLRSVDSERPKPMVEVLGRPFLYWLLSTLQRAKFNKFILSIGYKSKIIESYPWTDLFPKAEIECIVEQELLGTGGAVKNVFEVKKDLECAWVINGDTILQNPLENYRPPHWSVLYAALQPEQVFDAKPNLITKGGCITGIKDGAGNYFDGGQVFVTRQAVENFSGETPCSFHQLVKKSFEDKRVGFTRVPGTCYDIGTPERLKRFEKYLEENKDP